MIYQETMTPFDRLPPHDADAEMAVLGSLAICGNDKVVFATVKSIVSRGDFFSADNEVIFDTLCEMQSAGNPIDIITLRDRLMSKHLLEEIGGQAYLSQILNSMPSAQHAEEYAKVVHEKSLRRSLISISNEGMREGYANPRGKIEPIEKVLMEISSQCASLAMSGRSQIVHRLDSAIRDVMRRRQTGEVGRIKTGLRELDWMIGGLPVGGDTIVAGKPGMGKSALLKQFARNIASSKLPVGIITVEETRHKIAENFLASTSGVPNNRIAFGTAGPSEWAEIEHAAQTLDGLPVYIVDSVCTISAITTAANLLACQHGCKVIMVDHIHIVDGEPEKNMNREREISKISAALKFCWKSLNVAGIKAAQLNRSSGKDRPAINHLRDSGSLEQDGDTILLLHREDYYRKQDYKPGDAVPEQDGILEIIVGKNKSGATGTIATKFDEAKQTIVDVEPEDPFS